MKYKEDYMSLNEISLIPPQQGQFVQEDLAELGAMLTTVGLSVIETRAFIAKIQQIATQTALTMAPELLEHVRRINAARQASVYSQIRLLPQMAGYVSRDRVLQIVQSTYSTAPTQG
jgi:hypothetical protein